MSDGKFSLIDGKLTLTTGKLKLEDFKLVLEDKVTGEVTLMFADDRFTMADARFVSEDNNCDTSAVSKFECSDDMCMS